MIYIAGAVRARISHGLSRRQGMKTMYKTLLPVLAGVALLISAASGASAQGLSSRVVGTWTLVSGSENYPDGKKNVPWATGNLMLDSTDHLSFFLIGKDQPKTSPSVRTPVGPAVGYYGTYAVDEANSMLTYKIDQAMSPLQTGITRTQKVSFNGDIMTLTGSEIKTPEGTMIPVNEFKRAK
jgi:hypothetical protein